MKQSIFLVLALSVLLLGCSNSNSVQSFRNSLGKTAIAQTNPQKLPVTAKTKVGQQVIKLEVARTPEQQQLGLMYRQYLEDNRGMLFLFDPPRPVKFWMKNVSLSLDMIFLFDGEVKAIDNNVPPCRETPCPTYGPSIATEIDQVIELRGGRAEELEIEPGDRLIIEFLSSTEVSP